MQNQQGEVPPPPNRPSSSSRRVVGSGSSSTSLLFSSTPSVREIHKNAWLRVSISVDKESSKGLSLPSKDKWWVVFCVHDDVDPFLELYPDPKTASSHSPSQFVGLRGTLHVSPSLSGQAELAVTLSSGVVRLLARNWEQMIEWVESLQGKLRDMSILAPKDNVYSKPPTGIIKGCRDPNSPLPVVPVLPPSQQGSPGGVYELLCHAGNNNNNNNAVITNGNGHHHQRGLQRAVTSLESHSGHVRRSSMSSSLGRLSPSPPTSSSHPSPSSSSSDTLRSSGSSEPLEGMLGISAEGEYRIHSHSHSPERNKDSQSSSSSSSTPSSLPLKEAQTLRLQKEMNHPTGVRVVLRKRDLTSSLCLLDFQGAVWIAGWKQREFPVLYYAFHVGDRIHKVAGVPVTSAAEAMRAVRMASSLHVEIILNRLPLGKVWVLKREREGEPLGLVAEGGTGGQITEILEGGLAWRSGVRPPCNWYLTEVNHRPLSLFSKDQEVKDRLNAVGREISILVQPTDLVLHLKRGIKTMKGWRDYVVG